VGDRRRFVRESLGVALSQYLARAVIVLRGLASAAALGPHGYGGWNALNLIFDYGSYSSLGALQGLDLQLPAAAAAGETERAQRLMSGAWSIALTGGAAFAIGLALYLATGGSAFSAFPGVGLPLLMLVAALLQLAFQYLASSLRAFGRIPAVSAGYAIQAVLGGGLGLALVWRFGAWGLLAGWIAGTLVSLAFMRGAAREAPLAPARLREGWALLKLGFPIFAYFASTLVLRSVDRLALVRFGAPESLGLYSLGLLATGLVLYLPEAAGYVLFPRIAAVFHGGGDRARSISEAVRAHRALAVVMPLLVGLGMIWAEPVVGALLPAYRGGVPALRWLSLGALMLSAATVPGYYLLAAGRQNALTRLGAFAALVNAALVFAVASRAPRPESVAAAASTGYALFAVAVMALAMREWFERASERARLFATTLFPAIWAGGISLALCILITGSHAWSVAVERSLILVALAIPVLAWLGRGSGLATLVREWLGARGAATPNA
jgi:O-antigen/teichoic acid export membrane protein